jgi:flagellar biogenesis protein FliO
VSNQPEPAQAGNFQFAVKLFVIAGIVLAALWAIDKFAV